MTKAGWAAVGDDGRVKGTGDTLQAATRAATQGWWGRVKGKVSSHDLDYHEVTAKQMAAIRSGTLVWTEIDRLGVEPERPGKKLLGLAKRELLGV